MTMRPIFTAVPAIRGRVLLKLLGAALLICAAATAPLADQVLLVLAIGLALISLAFLVAGSAGMFALCAAGAAVASLIGA